VRLTRRNRVKQALAEYRRLHGGLGQFRLLTAAAVSNDSSSPAPSGADGSSSSNGAAEAAEVDLPLFERALTAVQRSHRLAETIGEKLSQQTTLHLSYEELREDHAAAMRAIEAFLGLGGGGEVGGEAGGGGGVGVVTHGEAMEGTDGASSPPPPPPPPPPSSSSSSSASSSSSSPPPRAAMTYSKATPDRLCEAVRNYGALCRKYAGTALAQHFDEPCDTACTPGAHVEARSSSGAGGSSGSSGGGGGGSSRSGGSRALAGGGGAPRGRSRKSAEAVRAKLAEGRVVISNKDTKRWQGGG